MQRLLTYTMNSMKWGRVSQRLLGFSNHHGYPTKPTDRRPTYPNKTSIYQTFIIFLYMVWPTYPLISLLRWPPYKCPCKTDNSHNVCCNPFLPQFLKYSIQRQFYNPKINQLNNCPKELIQIGPNRKLVLSQIILCNNLFCPVGYG